MNGSRSKMQTVLQLLGIGWYVAICIGGGALVGFWLDNWTGHSPIFVLLGLALGISVALIGMIRMLMAVVSGDSSSGEGKE